MFVAVVVFCPCLCVLSFAMLSPGYSGVVVVVVVLFALPVTSARTRRKVLL